MKKGFSHETKIEIWLKFDSKCGNCSSKQALQCHHLIHNTDVNIKVYGYDRVQSLENGFLCCQRCHDKYSLWDRELVSNLKHKWEEEISLEKERKLGIMKILSQRNSEVVELNPGEIYEVQGGVIEEIEINCVTATPAKTDEQKVDAATKNLEATTSETVRFDFTKNNDNEGVSMGGLSVCGIDFKSFKVSNPHDFTIIAFVAYTVRQ